MSLQVFVSAETKDSKRKSKKAFLVGETAWKFYKIFYIPFLCKIHMDHNRGSELNAVWLCEIVILKNLL